MNHGILGHQAGEGVTTPVRAPLGPLGPRWLSAFHSAVRWGLLPCGVVGPPYSFSIEYTTKPTSFFLVTMNTFAVHRQGSRPCCRGLAAPLFVVSDQMVIFMASVQTLGPNEWLRSERERMGIKKNGLVPKHQTIINHFLKKNLFWSCFLIFFKCTSS